MSLTLYLNIILEVCFIVELYRLSLLNGYLVDNNKHANAVHNVCYSLAGVWGELRPRKLFTVTFKVVFVHTNPLLLH